MLKSLEAFRRMVPVCSSLRMSAEYGEMEQAFVRSA